MLEIVEQGTSGDSPNMGHVLQKTKASPRFHPCFSLTVVDNQSPPNNFSHHRSSFFITGIDAH